jgi:hypothetical protein
MIHEREIGFRRRRIGDLAAKAAEDPDWQRLQPGKAAARDEVDRRLPMLLQDFASGGDIEEFRAAVDRLARTQTVAEVLPEFRVRFAAFIGQLIERTSDIAELSEMLRSVLEVPGGHDEASRKIADLVGQVEQVRSGAQPSAHGAIYFVSYAWSVQQAQHWPVMWDACENAVQLLGWLPGDTGPAAAYAAYTQALASLGEDRRSVESGLAWLDRTRWVGLDECIPERFEWALELNALRDGDAYPADLQDAAEMNVAAFLAEFRMLGNQGEAAVGAALGHEVTRVLPEPFWIKSRRLLRAHCWVDWRQPDSRGWTWFPGVRVHAAGNEVIVGIFPGRRGSSWSSRVEKPLRAQAPGGAELVRLKGTWPGSNSEAVTGDGEFILGWRLEPSEVYGEPEFAERVVALAGELRPAWEELMRLAEEDGASPGDGGVGTTQREPPISEDTLDAVAHECFLVDSSFLGELVGLLEDKGQIVLYGPPGTGKTHIARKLAEALAGEADRKVFVQFHPSTSYEDFFEGYRPATDVSGNLSYELTAGPLARLVEHAERDPRRHVLIIDELNRANVPKVFGELLFLLEYRGESVASLYRPQFTLPPNVCVIATMNTADRSIAHLDAALRRRFHFVPLLPDEGPMIGLLDRFLQRAGGDRQWAALVDRVNAELRDRLGNADQLIGPSYFLDEDLNEDRMARVWRYSIEPLMEDLFWGDQQAIAEFRWPVVLKNHRDATAATSDVEAASDSFAVPAEAAIPGDASLSAADVPERAAEASEGPVDPGGTEASGSTADPEGP